MNDQTISERFAESDLLGIPRKVVLGNRFRETGDVELADSFATDPQKNRRRAIFDLGS
ncbi:hypothetical protein KU306_01050 [Haloferax larsenii]|uniref:Uncharacterized protein n=1 Tax=Haloferax larsenii TaxID=302484 RepID=A0ABY5RGI2_HALLR|nr:His/Gly/Thr/Pro-type tRNA ligase C-terminal domain-containing protein [Haloferax larsenii]UVE50528.1 hypothetical protein KU306_01050 [Haloferax larsenii]